MSDYMKKLKRGSGLDSYGNAYQFPYEIEAVSAIEAKDKRIAELNDANDALIEIGHNQAERIAELEHWQEFVRYNSKDAAHMADEALAKLLQQNDDV